MSSLYELTADWLTLYNMIDNPEDWDEDALIDTLEGIDGEIEIKAEGYAKVIKNLAAEAEALKAEEERLYKRRKVKENAIARMKANLQASMEATGKTKFKTELFSFSVQANAPAVVLDVEEPSEVPEEYRKVTVDFDKTAIKEALKKGEKFKFAHLEQSSSLRIR